MATSGCCHSPPFRYSEFPSALSKVIYISSYKDWTLSNWRLATFGKAVPETDEMRASRMCNHEKS